MRVIATNFMQRCLTSMKTYCFHFRLSLRKRWIESVIIAIVKSIPTTSQILRLTYPGLFSKQITYGIKASPSLTWIQRASRPQHGVSWQIIVLLFVIVRGRVFIVCCFKQEHWLVTEILKWFSKFSLQSIVWKQMLIVIKLVTPHSKKFYRVTSKQWVVTIYTKTGKHLCH